MSKNFKWFSSESSVSPQLSNNWGSYSSLLDACLVDGFGEAYPISITSDGTYVTFNYETAHNYLLYQTILVEAAEINTLNGEFIIHAVSADGLSFTIKLEGLSDIPVGFTKTKVAPLGWVRHNSEGDDRVFQTASTVNRNFYYFVENSKPPQAHYQTTWTKYARVGAAEGWAGGQEPTGLTHPVDWDTFRPLGGGADMFLGSNKIVYNANRDVSETFYLSNVARDGNTPYYLIGNEEVMYFACTCSPAHGNFHFTGFGNYQTLHEGFQHNMFLSVCTYNNSLNNAMAYHYDTSTLITNTNTSRTLSGYGNSEDKELWLACFPNLSRSGYTNALGHGGHINLLQPFFRDSNVVLMGYPEGLYWLARTTPYNHGIKFNRGGEIFLALSMYVSSYWSQIVVKIGDLNA